MLLDFKASIVYKHIYHLMKHFSPEGCGLFQDDPTPMLEAARFDEEDNNVNHMQWPFTLATSQL